MTDPSVPIVPGRPAPAPQPPPPAPARTKNSTILWIVAGLVVAMLLVGGFVAVLASLTNGPGQSAAASDVSTPDCGHSSGSRNFVAQVTVTNSTDKPRDYTVTIVFLRGDKTEITTGVGRVNRLQPGKSFHLEVVGRADSEFVISCEVESVRRV